jgi:anti-sigma factor RsiW
MDRYFDKELSGAERARAQAHAERCAACRRHLEQNRAVADLFQSDTDRVLSDSEKIALEDQVIGRLGGHQAGIRHGWKVIFTPKRLIPLAALAGLLMVVFSFVFEADIPSGPSAIVNSFQGDYQSVMILETPEKRNTIIWLVETT